jgi:hypothetical protein
MIPPAFGSYGTAGANIFRGMPYYNLDFSITKTIKFRERLTAQFRAEAFNVFNHTEWNGYPGTFVVPAADMFQYNGAHLSRILQLGAKFIF